MAKKKYEEIFEDFPDNIEALRGIVAMKKELGIKCIF